MSKALLASTCRRRTWGSGARRILKYDKPALLRAVNDVIDARSGAGCMVVYVRNATKRSLIKRLVLFKVYEGTPESELVERFACGVGPCLREVRGRRILQSRTARVFKAERCGIGRDRWCGRWRLRGADSVGRNRKRLPCGCQRAGHRHDVRTQQSEVFQKTTKNWAPNSSDGSQPSARIFFRSPNVFLRFAGLPACGRRLSGNLQKDVFLFVH